MFLRVKSKQPGIGDVMVSLQPGLQLAIIFSVNGVTEGTKTNYSKAIKSISLIVLM